MTIVGLAFGHQGILGRGKSNEALANDYVRVYRERYDLPLTLQWELAYFLDGMIKRDCVIWGHGLEDNCLDTRQVLLQAMEICDKKLGGTRKIILIAHPHHLWRAMMNAKKLGFEPIIPMIANVPYDPYSHQWWTRSKWAFVPYEIATRLVYLWKGWI